MARLTDPKTVRLIQSELEGLINNSKEFSNKLKDLIKEHDIDTATERKATVEALQIILQKWVVEILHVLFIEETLRFNEIKRNLKGISSRTLTSKLRTLEDEEFIERLVLSERPMVMGYTLTTKGKTLAQLSSPIIYFLKLKSQGQI